MSYKNNQVNKWEVFKIEEYYGINSVTIQIWRISYKKNFKEFLRSFSSVYLVVKLNGKLFYKRRILTEQFIPNPNNYCKDDHIYRDNIEYCIVNLRYVSFSENCTKKSSHMKVYYNYIHKIDGNCIIVDKYGNHGIWSLFYDENEGQFYLKTVPKNSE